LSQFTSMIARLNRSQNQVSVPFCALQSARSAPEHLSEIAEILAVGLQRAFARKSSEVCATTGESSLHILPNQSGDPTSENRRTSDA
jgi:hypothetical protein